MSRRPNITVPSLVLLAGVSLGAGSDAGAASRSGGFAVRGVGAQKCGELVARIEQDRSGPAIEHLAAWTAGYLSHLNRATPGTYDAMPVVDNGVVAQVVANVCRSNADAFVETVLATLAVSFASGSIGEESELIEVAAGDNRTMLRRAVFRLVQEHLIEEGHLSPGSADGYYGPRSGEGLRNYQKANGLTETGIPDPATLISIFANAGDAGSRANP